MHSLWFHSQKDLQNPNFLTAKNHEGEQKERLLEKHMKTSRVTGMLIWLMKGFYKVVNTSKQIL